jgi:hypothetical protein
MDHIEKRVNSATVSGETGLANAVSRRGFFRLASGGAVAGSALALLSACSGLVPTAPTSVPSGSTSSSAASAYPNFFPVTSGPKPDFVAIGPQYQNGFINFPRTLCRVDEVFS